MKSPEFLMNLSNQVDQVETRKILYLHHFINNVKPFAGKAADPNALTSIANLGAHGRILGLKHMRYSYW